jgi:hypothetical protein
MIVVQSYSKKGPWEQARKWAEQVLETCTAQNVRESNRSFGRDNFFHFNCSQVHRHFGPEGSEQADSLGISRIGTADIGEFCNPEETGVSDMAKRRFELSKPCRIHIVEERLLLFKDSEHSLVLCRSLPQATAANLMAVGFELLKDQSLAQLCCWHVIE